MGCPTSYNGKTFTWNKGKLTQVSQSSTLAGTTRYTYTYNGKGQRVQKVYTFLPGQQALVDYTTRATTTYTYDNAGRLIREYRSEIFKSLGTSNREFIYLYDESGMIGFNYILNGVDKGLFYYKRNLQGDVVAILDTNGNNQGSYSYDAYGNTTVSSYGSAGVASINPIRYRGYYYDTETSWYFLNARYYNPEWRRFLSPDDTAYLDPENVNGLNLYCYCNNDPINFVDPSGHEVEWYNILGLIGVGLVIAAATVLTMGAFGIAVGGAGLLGSVIYSAAVGTLIGAGVGIVGGAAGGIIYDAVTGNEFGTNIWAGVQAGFGIGAIAGAVIGGYTGYAAFHGHSVYISTSDGTVNYVGRTNDIVRRTAEHATAGRGIVPKEVASKLTLKQARGLEQALINKYGMIKNGGTLLNRINSIATSNPIYAKAVAWGNRYIKSHFWKFI